MASASQHTLVDLVCALSTLQTDSVLQLVKEVVKRPLQIKGDEVSSLWELPGRASFLMILPINCDPGANAGFLGCNEGLSLCCGRGLRGSGAVVRGGSYLRLACLSRLPHTLPGALFLAPSVH